jgi:hypothetical protein
MAAIRCDITLACKGDPGEAHRMWLAISRPKKGTQEREIAFQELSSLTAKNMGRFLSSCVIDERAFINSFHGEKSRGNPEKLYPALAKAFPGLGFFIIQRCSEESRVSLTSFEAKNGRARISGTWEYEAPELCEARQAWLEALQGRWLRDREDTPELCAETAEEPLATEEAEDGPRRAEKTAAAHDLLAVQSGGEELAHVKKQTPKICLAAVKNSGSALRFVKKQTPKICRAALRQDGLALEFVREQTRELCLAAVKQNYLAYRFVRETTLSIFRLFCEGLQKKMDQIAASHQSAT